MACSASVRDPAVAEINITPLVDAMLVLLAIFMVPAPMIAQPLAAALPQSSPSPRPTPPVLQLEVTGAGACLLDGRPTDTHEPARKRAYAVAGDAGAADGPPLNGRRSGRPAHFRAAQSIPQAGKDRQIILHGMFQPGVQRFGNQGVADGDFKHVRHRFKELHEVGLAQVVAGVDAKPQ